MNKYATRLWIVVIVLGWAFDFLFWGRMPGLNFAIFMALTLVGGLNLLLLNEIKPDWKSLLLIVPFAAFAFVTFWRQEPLTIFLAYLFTLLSLGLLTVSYMGGRWVRYSLIDYLYRFALLAVSILGSPLMFLFQVRKEQKELGESPKKLPAGADRARPDHRHPGSGGFYGVAGIGGSGIQPEADRFLRAIRHRSHRRIYPAPVS